MSHSDLGPSYNQEVFLDLVGHSEYVFLNAQLPLTSTHSTYHLTWLYVSLPPSGLPVPWGNGPCQIHLAFLMPGKDLKTFWERMNEQTFLRVAYSSVTLVSCPGKTQKRNKMLISLTDPWVFLNFSGCDCNGLHEFRNIYVVTRHANVNTALHTFILRACGNKQQTQLVTCHGSDTGLLFCITAGPCTKEPPYGVRRVVLVRRQEAQGGCERERSYLSSQEEWNQHFLKESPFSLKQIRCVLAKFTVDL